MGILRFLGTLCGGPPTVCDSGQFPSSVFLVDLSFAGGHDKQYDPATGVLRRNISSPTAFLPLTGLGPSDVVTKGDFLWMKASSPMLLQITSDDGSGGDVVAVIPIGGVFVLEARDDKFLKTIALQGSGSVEYLVTGQS